MNKEEIVREFLSKAGKKGGSVKSERKAQASRENGKKGGRPKSKHKNGGFKMKKVLKNVEIADKVVKELEKKGYEVSYEKVLDLIDLSRGPIAEKNEEVNIADYVEAFETIEQEKEFNR